jgi:hypothetical protein
MYKVIKKSQTTEIKALLTVLFLHDDGRIRIREDQNLTDPDLNPDPEPERCAREWNIQG